MSATNAGWFQELQERQRLRRVEQQAKIDRLFAAIDAEVRDLTPAPSPSARHVPRTFSPL